ncbi:uncharacterized protein LOC131665842 [Phymastichus coffea]|uniref:uncharacterized protein LOC131665842 n=1 Tax=Phymastichus coffea TaxID=108790 RepID=UPI00273AA6F0|nr:uncharacterized protein LOC131665842 [Phymastichus coffea]
MSGPGASGAGLGCIAECTSGLTADELDRITDHVQCTLSSAQGRRIFRQYLSEARRRTDVACLELHEQCCRALDDERLSRPGQEAAGVEPLLTDVGRALSLAEDLDGVPEIDLALLERYTEALESRSRDALLAVLEETKSRLMNHLRQAHKGFRAYAKQPRPRTG